MEKTYEKIKLYVNEDVEQEYYSYHIEYFNSAKIKFLDVFLEVKGSETNLFIYDWLNKEWQIYLDEEEGK